MSIYKLKIEYATVSWFVHLILLLLSYVVIISCYIHSFSTNK